ncbi:MAG TPA: carbohydrate ABC transporter permease [Candidatus Limnocylindrales bacterium]|nr:carbohydrate ABC transporter permease [Candidatus Limnocylindrales bacterium]
MAELTTSVPDRVERAAKTTARPRLVAFGRPTLVGTVAYVILVTVAAAIVVPLVYAILGGFKTNGQLVADPVSIVPSPWVLSNYLDVVAGQNAGQFWRSAANSAIVATVAVGVTVTFASFAAFVFARMAFRGREALYTLFVLGLLFPSAVAILPLYVLIRQLGLTGNLLGVALPQAAFSLPLTIVILRPFFRSIPAELEDAARIDGCSSFGFLWRVLLPLARPALATVSVLAIVTTWNAFLLPLILLNGADQWTLPLGVMNFSTQYGQDQARVLAFTVISMLPAVVYYILAERQIVGGLTAGAVKG